MSKTYNVAVLVGSLRKASINRKLAKARRLLLVRGATSDILAAGLAQRMAAVSSNVRLVEVPEVGHAPNLSEPEARKAIERFLAEAD